MVVVNVFSFLSKGHKIDAVLQKRGFGECAMACTFTPFAGQKYIRLVLLPFLREDAMQQMHFYPCFMGTGTSAKTPLLETTLLRQSKRFALREDVFSKTP